MKRPFFFCNRTTGFFFCKETTLHGKKSLWLLDMFQLDLAKIKEVQTDESLKGTGKMPVCVLALIYILRERKLFPQRWSLTTEKKNNNSNKPDAEKEVKDFIQSDICRHLVSAEMNIFGLQLKIYFNMNGIGMDVSVIRQHNFPGLLSKTSQLPTSMSMFYSLFSKGEALYICNENLFTTSLLFLAIFCGLLSNRPPIPRVKKGDLGEKLFQSFE